MNSAYGRSSAAAMVFAGIAMRIFCGMGIEYAAAYNASWLCPVAGLALSLPFALNIRLAGRMGNDSPWNNLSARSPKWLSGCLTVLFAAALLYDCAIILRLTASTANFVSLNDVSLPWLTLPLLLTAFAVACLPADTEGNNVRIWLLLLPILLIIVAAVQFRSYNPSWLTPILGGGLSAIAQGGLQCGGWTALLFLPWLTAVPDRKKNNPLRPGILAVCAASVLLIALQMLCPALVETNLSEIARGEIILSNNRVSHILQMFLTLLWFGSLLHLICIEISAAVSFVLNKINQMPRWAAAAVCTTTAGIISISDLVRNSITGKVYIYQFIIIGAGFALIMIICIFGNRGNSHA